ncbi:MAG TPA: hypothetical protein VGP40_04905, partial [Chthoniobacterales bacterium]|nr:hypothetical protein [Chthoniobacterales bacterium]
GLWVDAERARFVRRPLTEILNSRGEWEPANGAGTNCSLGDLLVYETERWVAALSLPRFLDGRGFGNLCKLRDKGIYGREIPLGTLNGEGVITPVKWLRKHGSASFQLAEPATEQAGSLHYLHFSGAVRPLLRELAGGEVSEFVTRGNTISARLDFSTVEVAAIVDSHGRALHSPPEREAIPLVCRSCDQLEHDSTAQITSSPAYAWRRLGLVEEDGTPTRRGVMFSFFQGGEGLAVAAALEDENYPIDELVFDLANIRGGPRFAGEDAVMGGRLGILSQRIYERADHPGYLEMGTPLHYGSGASEVIREVVANPGSRYRLTNDALRLGDIERALMEWRSLLRHIVNAPDLDWNRWRALKTAAQHFVETTTSPALLQFPPLLAAQQRRALMQEDRPQRR